MCVEFTAAADPSSKVFTNMARSRRTVVRRMNDIFSHMKDELKDEIQKAMFFGIMAGSTDATVSEQLILYMWYVQKTQPRTQKHRRRHAPTQAHTHIHINTQEHAHTRTYTHSLTHTPVLTHTHAHNHNISREEIITRFAGIQEVEGHANAENLFKVADGILADHSVPKEFIVCSTVDGASAMFSAKKISCKTTKTIL